MLLTVVYFSIDFRFADGPSDYKLIDELFLFNDIGLSSLAGNPKGVTSTCILFVKELASFIEMLRLVAFAGRREPARNARSRQRLHSSSQVVANTDRTKSDGRSSSARRRSVGGYLEKRW